ncbi:chemotaxis protein [Myxococcaceae bacterium GXIMD 01537]
MAPRAESGARTRPLLSALAAVLAALLSACSTMAPRTGLQQRVGNSDLDVGALRIRVRDMARRLPGLLEVAADDIAAASDSAEIRRRMLEFKSNAVPALQGALFQPDPVAALVDAWALVAQLQESLPERAKGVAKPLVDKAANALLQQEQEIEAVWKELADDADTTQMRARVHEWAAEHPLEGPIYARQSTAPLLATLTQMSRIRPLSAAATLLEDTRDLAARADVYSASLPRQARWQAEILATELSSSAMESPALRSAVDELARTVDVLDRLGTLAAGTPALVARERKAVLDSVNQERLALQTFITGERKAVLADVGSERAIVLDALHTERVQALQQLDGLAHGWVDHAFDRADRLVNHIFLWVLALAALALLGGLGLVLLLRGRRPSSRGSA